MTVGNIYIEFDKITALGRPCGVIGGPWDCLQGSLGVLGAFGTISPRVTQAEPSWANHRSPRVHMRQQTHSRSHSRHDCCVRQLTCLLSGTTEMSDVQQSRHVCFVRQQKCLITVGLSRHVCCVDTADMSAVRHSRLFVGVYMHAGQRRREGGRVLC